MKKLTFMLLFLSSTAFCQEKRFIDGAWGITFGSSQSIARGIATSKGASFDAAGSRANTQIFTNIIFAQRQVDTLQLSYYQNQLWRAVLTYPIYTELKVMDEYHAIINELNKVYGNAQLIDNFMYPYKKESDDNVYTITKGEVDHRAIWTVRDQGRTESTIELRITPELRFILTYTCGPLKQLVDKQNMKIKTADY